MTMTSKHWRRCDDPIEMIGTLKGVASDRKGRLYLCGGCRAIWDLLYDDRSREAVEVAERFVGRASDPGGEGAGGLDGGNPDVRARLRRHMAALSR